MYESEQLGHKIQVLQRNQNGEIQQDIKMATMISRIISQTTIFR